MIGGKWLAQSTIYRDAIDLVFVQEIGDQLAVAQPTNFIMKQQPRHEAIAQPTLSLPHGPASQSLMQALWDAGLRPNNGAGSGAENEALKKHVAFAERMADGLLAKAST